MPALLTKMSSGPKISAVLVTAARSSSAEALSAFIASALPPPDSTSCTSFSAFSSELEKVNATDAPSEASRRTMPAPMPLEPPVTRATLPLNDLVCIAIHILQLDSYTFWMSLSRIGFSWPRGHSHSQHTPKRRPLHCRQGLGSN